MVRAVSRLLALSYDVVGSVAEGAGLLPAAQELRPDVIVLDVHLPTSTASRRAVRSCRRNPEMKIVMFTAADDPVLERRALEAGAYAFVNKLAAVNDLLSTLERLDSERGG
jgi:AmiR/NasT family two-component response regulator